MKRAVLALALLAACAAEASYQPPPGLAEHHYAAGFAKILCSAVFISGFDAADAAEHLGGFTAPFPARRHVVDTVIDAARQEVRVRLADGVTRTARRYGSQGCVTHAPGEDSVHFRPSVVASRLPPAATTPWPMGDLLPPGPAADLDSTLLSRAIDSIFGPPDAMTLAVVVTHRGRLIGERYAPGVRHDTPLESWSMTKSLTGALMGVLIEQGAYRLWQRAPIPEWSEGDERRAIRIGDLMRMSSGLRARAPQDPDYDSTLGYPDHLYFYTGPDAFRWAATRPLQWPPNTVGRYRNTDVVLTGYLIRLAVERRGDDYHAFPWRALFDRIGIRSAIIETDPQGNFLGQGYGYLSARDWARLGNLYLQDGIWLGERVLPEGYAGYAATVAPAWQAGGRPVYGGAFVWLEEGRMEFRGAGGQFTIIDPAQGLVVVRLGKYRGATPGTRALRAAFPLLIRALPPA